MGRIMQTNIQTKVAQVSEKVSEKPVQPIVEPDDRYPGTFFRIPGVPLPGKTTWSLAK